MKKTLILAYAALVFVYLLPFVFRESPPSPEPTAASPLPAVQVRAHTGEAPATPLPAGAKVPSQIRVLTGDTVTEMDMQDYLVGVVAAEMPASFPHEALKAQAVAARTYAMYCAAGGKHAEADVCADFSCCQAWLPDARLRENWGGDYEENLRVVLDAVAETEGEYLSYGGAPVFAAFHSSSAGATEDCGAIWSALPYLVSVESPEGAGDVPGYISSLRCAPLDFRDTVLSAYPQADFTGEPGNWLGEIQRDASGRVAACALGGVSVPGTELRKLFSLRSTAFTLEYTEGYFVFTVTGNGHGVGMSQYGAKVLAEDGTDYAQILAHYYPGTVLVKST